MKTFYDTIKIAPPRKSWAGPLKPGGINPHQTSGTSPAKTRRDKEPYIGYFENLDLQPYTSSRSLGSREILKPLLRT
jgi:hypothetical protein